MPALNSPLESPSAGAFHRDAKVIGLVASAHCLSHFFQLALPPLFLLLKAEFGVSYAALGAVMSVFYVASGFCQFGAGFAVDRFGARPVLLGGMALLAGGTALTGAAPAFGWLFPLAALMGIGNGVFHPADFAILNARVDPRRLGHAFSMHGVGGSLGYALAPVCSYALGSALGWRTALVLLGIGGFVALCLVASQARLLVTQGHRGNTPRAGQGFAMFLQTPVLLCFLFFSLLTTATIGIQTFGAAALNSAYSVPMVIATSAITGYLLGSTTGIVAGGFLAGRTRRHDVVAATGLTIGAALLLLVAVAPMPAAWLIPIFVVAGFALGCTGPSRDMIVRGVTPAGASGRTYGFVYSGLDLGSTIGPVCAGLLLDHGQPRMVLVLIAGFLLLAIATVMQARRGAAPREASIAAAE